jgi:hypothetical protein
VPTVIDCLIESGAKRTFASAASWPGWCRGGRDEYSAMESMQIYGARYSSVLIASEIRFSAPSAVSALRVLERAPGNATTDFGAPDGSFDADAQPVAAREWTRLRTVLQACWSAFDRAVAGAEGVELRKGPRGGGRELDAIVAHVVTAEASYLRRLTAAGVTVDEADAWNSRELERAAVLEWLDRARAGDVPEHGPRGGAMWTPRRFVRRTAWHVLDHAWEIEDRKS